MAQVLAELDHRERGGYTRHSATLEFPHLDGEQSRGVVWVATPENPNYLGPAGLEEIAQQVRGSSGPSGHNTDYVLRLAEALREIGADDPHVFALERLVRSARSPNRSC